MLPAPDPVDAAPMPMMNGTARYAQPPLTNPVRHPFLSGYHLATMLMQLEYTMPEPMPPSTAYDRYASQIVVDCDSQPYATMPQMTPPIMVARPAERMPRLRRYPVTGWMNDSKTT